MTTTETAPLLPDASSPAGPDEPLSADYSATTAVLLEELERLPVQQSAALHVVRLADDPRASSQDVGLAISADPVLTTRVLRMANSTYYGLSGRVATPSFAVTLLGRETVRSLAAAAAAGLSGDAESMPAGFWYCSSATAAAAALLAPRVGANRSEAFCLGMLHDIGSALLHRIDPEAHLALLRRGILTGVHPLALELDVYGVGHDEAGARVLSAWRFPYELTDAVASHHHDPRAAVTPLERCLHAAKAVVRSLPQMLPSEAPFDVDGALRAGRVKRKEEAELCQRVQEQAEQLAATLAAG